MLFYAGPMQPRTVVITSLDDQEPRLIVVNEDTPYWLLALPAGSYTLSPPGNVNYMKHTVTVTRWDDKARFMVRPGVITYVGDFSISFTATSFTQKCDIHAAESFLVANYPEKSKTLALVNRCLQ